MGYSGFLDILEALLKFVYALVMVNMCWRDTQVQIWLVILILENQLLGLDDFYWGELCVGNQSCKHVLLSLSSTEAKYVTNIEVGKKLLWIKSFL